MGLWSECRYFRIRIVLGPGGHLPARREVSQGLGEVAGA